MGIYESDLEIGDNWDACDGWNGDFNDYCS